MHWSGWLQGRVLQDVKDGGYSSIDRALERKGGSRKNNPQRRCCSWCSQRHRDPAELLGQVLPLLPDATGIWGR